MRRKPSNAKLNAALKVNTNLMPEKKDEPEGNIETMISTGCTLLDLAICGGRVRGGGLPSGIMVEIFGPAGSGKTVLLCEIAGGIQRQGGEIMFKDPEARLNAEFASMFDLAVKEVDYARPNTVPEVFEPIRQFKPKSKGKNIVNGVLADSLAALSTSMEMDNAEGDKMGMRRAKEFSEQLRKTCRLLPELNLLLVCSNQVRVKTDAGKYENKYITPGGEAIGFYSSVRLRCGSPQKIKKAVKIKGKEYKKVIGIETPILVHKNSTDKPYRETSVTILFDYGIDDIRSNLAYVKKITASSKYYVNDVELAVSMEKSIEMVEEQDLIDDLREQVIDLWEMVESKFVSPRRKKIRKTNV